MRKMFICLALSLFMCASLASAEEMTVQLVREKCVKAAALLEAEGEASFSKLRDESGEFRFADKKGYVWVQDLDSNMLMHPIKPAMEGNSLMDVKDAEGHFMFVGFSDVAEEHGHGWVPYVWPKPGATDPSPKISYLKLVEKDGSAYVVGSGMYDAVPSDVKALYPDDPIYEYE